MNEKKEQRVCRESESWEDKSTKVEMMRHHRESRRERDNCEYESDNGDNDDDDNDDDQDEDQDYNDDENDSDDKVYDENEFGEIAENVG